jgi:hypothetical protein
VRCHICDSKLKPEEIDFNRKHEEWDPCRNCLEVIEEAIGPLLDEEVDEAILKELLEMGLLDESDFEDTLENP